MKYIFDIGVDDQQDFGNYIFQNYYFANAYSCVTKYNKSTGLYDLDVQKIEKNEIIDIAAYYELTSHEASDIIIKTKKILSKNEKYCLIGFISFIILLIILI